MKQREEVEGVGVKECLSECARETRGRKLGGRVAGSSDPNTSAKEESPNLSFCPLRGRGEDLEGPPRAAQVLVGEVCERARVPV